ncbi:hypothetical protein TNCV_1749211 [Trichonephila clavipes]|nr:hypothetical protein TNCV_1749211 [Trichonephila clavipes]
MPKARSVRSKEFTSSLVLAGGTYLRGKERTEGDLGQRVRFPTGGFSGRRKREKSLENSHVRAFKADHTTSKIIRYGFITIKSTTLIELNSPRKNTTLSAIRFVEPRCNPYFL